MMNEHLNNKNTTYEELGYQYQAPAALAFLQWIEPQCKADGVGKLLFIAGDGSVLEQLGRTYFGSRLPPLAYFMGSRTAFNLAAIDETNFHEQLPFLMADIDGLSPAALFERIGLQPPAESVMVSLGISPQMRITAQDYDLIKKLVQGYRPEILKRCRQNRRGLFIYLNQLEIKRGDKVALVAVGWSGATQEAFERVVASLMNIEVIGYYFCLANSAEKQLRMRYQKMKALLHHENCSAATIDKIYANRLVVELLFSAPHDTVIGYKMLKDKVMPVMDCGRIKDANHEVINAKLQVGVAAFLQDHMPLSSTPGEYIAPNQLVENLVNALQHNSWEDNKLFR